MNLVFKNSTKIEKISKQWRKFVSEYIKNPSDPAGAYIRAGYKTENEKYAEKAAAKLLKRPEIIDAMEELQENIIEKVKSRQIMKRGEGLEILSEMGRASVADFYDANNLIDLKSASLPLHAVKEITFKTDKNGTVVTNVKLYDKKAVIDEIANIQGWKKNADEAQPDELNKLLERVSGTSLELPPVAPESK